MTRRLLWTGACVLAALLAFPKTGSAGIGEIILEMSGPQMIGGGLECKFSLNGSLEQCYVTGLMFGSPAPQSGPRLRLSLETGAYVSTGKDQKFDEGTIDYRFRGAYMLTFDPMLELVTWDNKDAKSRKELYHGVMGASYNFLFGDFRRFSNVGFKLRPIGYRYKRMNFEYNLRIYPHRYSAADFGKIPLHPEGDQPEVTHGFSIGIAIGNGA